MLFSFIRKSLTATRGSARVVVIGARLRSPVNAAAVEDFAIVPSVRGSLVEKYGAAIGAGLPIIPSRRQHGLRYRAAELPILPLSRSRHCLIHWRFGRRRQRDGRRHHGNTSNANTNR